MRVIRFYVMEDVPDFREAVVNTLNETNECEVVGSSDTITIGYEEILSLKPDALLLDIELFGGSAFDLIRMLRNNNVPVPPIVIMTGNVQFDAAKQAVDECGTALIKLIGKPFWSTWEKEFPSIKAAILSRLSGSNSDDAETSIILNETKEVLYIRSNQMTHRINVADILFLEVAGEGQTTFVMTGKRQVTVRKTLNVLMNLLPDHIRRVNRFNAVNIHRMLNINHEDDTMTLDGYTRPISIGDPYMQELKALLT
ncbi:MAG: LytTR family transcriptional regulator DNA-binding domain-containing protein [Saprospiraceae bacterium]